MSEKIKKKESKMIIKEIKNIGGRYNPEIKQRE